MINGVDGVQRAAQPLAARAREAPDSAAKLSTFQASTETQSRLTIVTEDGDRVTLSSHSTAEIGYADYRYLGEQAGARAAVHGQALTVSASRELEVSVDGALSRDELHDIRKLVHDLDKVVRDFLRGRDEKAAGRAARIGDLGSVAGFELVVEHEERQTTSVQTESRQADAPGGPSAGAAPDDSAPGDGGALASLVERVTTALREATRALGKTERLLPRLVTDLMDGLEQDHTLEPHRPHLDRLRRALLERLDDRDHDEPSTSADPEASTTHEASTVH